MEDQRLFCRDCGTEYFITAGERLFYQDRGLSLPSRCSDCRSQRRTQRKADVSQSTTDWRLALETPLEVEVVARGLDHGRDDTWGGNETRRFFTAFCDECGRETEIPFRPRGDRPVYCRDCYNARRGR